MNTQNASSSFPSTRRAVLAFTLVELLVVIGIIALLISILLPALSSARQSAAALASLSNLRQLGNGLVMYVNENKGFYPVHAFPSLSDRARTRWVDATYTYMKNTEVYISPNISQEERPRFDKPFNHTTTNTSPTPSAYIAGVTKFYGGYGYNWQYLGNGRTNTANPIAFFAKAGANIRSSSQTIAVADTNGSKDGGTTWTPEGTYAIDPPLKSVALGSKGGRVSDAQAAAWGGDFGYRGGSGGILLGEGGATTSTPGDPARRSTPAERNKKKVNVLFCDGHAKPMSLKEMDDFNGDGQVDNGWWNGKADASVR